MSDEVMAEPTINGAPVKPVEGWIVLLRWSDRSYWWPLRWTIGQTRAKAVRRYNEWVPRDDYEQDRRQGTAIAVRCRIEPYNLPETVGDADRRMEYDG